MCGSETRPASVSRTRRAPARVPRRRQEREQVRTREAQASATTQPARVPPRRRRRCSSESRKGAMRKFVCQGAGGEGGFSAAAGVFGEV